MPLLADGVTASSALEHIDVRGNPIGAPGEAMLGRALRQRQADHRKRERQREKKAKKKHTKVLVDLKN